MSGFQPCTLFLCLIITFSQLHFTASKPTGLSLKLIPGDSPESPLYPGNLTQSERMKRLIQFTKARAPRNATFDPDDTHFRLDRDKYFFSVEMFVGSQQTPLLLLMDTGAGLIWTQCEPCKSCFPQQGTRYDSRTSTTYQKLPCDHPLCQGNRRDFQCVNEECTYDFGFAGGARTIGVASMETFTFVVDQTKGSRVDGLIFGCSNDNQGFNFQDSGTISGIMGMSMSSESLVGQLFDFMDHEFSYCFVPFSDQMVGASMLRFGNDIPIPSGNMLTTMFVTSPGSTHFQLNLKDISVGFRRLGIPASTFEIREDGSGGCFIDSGALLSVIDETTINGVNAYRVVLEAFQAYYDSWKLTRKGVGTEGLELCYEQPQGFDAYTSMTFHFEGAPYTVDPKYTILNNSEEGYFCIALYKGTGFSLLGAWQQQNMRIIYSGKVGALQFYPDHCADDHQ